MAKPFPFNSLYGALNWPEGEPRPDGVDVYNEDESEYIVDDYLTLEWIYERARGEAVWFHTRVDAWNDPERISDFTIVNVVMSRDMYSLCPVLPAMRYLPEWLVPVMGDSTPWKVRIPGDTWEEQRAFVDGIAERVKLSMAVRQALEKVRRR